MIELDIHRNSANSSERNRKKMKSMHIVIKLLKMYDKEKTNQASGENDKGTKVRRMILMGNNVDKKTMEHHLYSTELKKSTQNSLSGDSLLQSRSEISHLRFLSDQKEAEKMHHQQTCTVGNAKERSCRRFEWKKMVVCVFLVRSI